MDPCLSLADIRQSLDHISERYDAGEIEQSMADIARRACISKQTLYAVRRDDRSQFGVVAQIRLSRVVRQVMAEIATVPSRRLRVTLGRSGPRIGFGIQPPKPVFSRQG